MNLQKLIFTNNDCYKEGRTITVKGIMVHSTGANNPNLKRYVAPNDGKLGANTNNNDWNRSGTGACVHGFIGKLEDGSIATYQVLPWNHRGWHCGSGTKGSGNDGYISFEICEDGLADGNYFGKVYKEAVELCAYLCKLYNLNPQADGVVICHSEGCARGIATNHADVMHWFPKHGKNMVIFRNDVKTAMSGSASSVVNTTTTATSTSSQTNSIGCLDTFKRTTNSNELEISGWHHAAKSGKYRYIFLMDYNTDKELARVKSNLVARPDVKKVYSYAYANTGFSGKIGITSNISGKKVYIMVRYTDDVSGNNPISDYSFRDKSCTIAASLKVGKCTGNDVMVRSTPEKRDNNILRTLNAGNLFDILGVEGSWTKVNVAGTIGYVSSQYVG